MPYNSQGVPLSQLRKLQLSDDDRALMNKVKTQVDEEQFLHNESDPRYRGASIPSRAFRMLQNMTDHPGDYMTQVPQGSGSPSVLSNRRPQPQGCETHDNWPEQINNVEGEQASYSYPHPYDDPNNYYANNGYYYDLNQPPQTPEEQQQFWEHYNAMCAYMAEMNAAAYRYSPFPHAYPPPVTPVPPPPHPLSTHYFSDSDGYSSTDEMAYYGAYFQRRPPPAPLPNYRMFRGRSATPTPAPRIVITPTEHSSTKSETDAECKKAEINTNTAAVTSSTELENSSSGSDTEVDDDDDDNNDDERLTGLKTIRSVPDINIYKDSTGSDISSSIPRSDSGSVKEEDDEDEDDDDEVEEVHDEEHYDDDSSLHQLSVIYEESEHSSLSSKAGRRDSVISEEDASSATLDNCDNTDSEDDDGIADSDTVTVRLPLKLKFSKAGDDRDMATVIVGKSEVQPTNEGAHRQSPEKKDIDSIVTDNGKAEKVDVESIQPESRIDEQQKSQEIIIVEEEEEQDVTSEEENSEAIVIEKEPEGMIVEEITRDEFEADVSVTISLKKLKPKPENSVVVEEKSVSETIKDSSARGNSPEVDFWKTLNSEDESVSGNEVTARGSISSATEEDEARPEESDGHWEDDSSSTSVQTVRTSDATFKPTTSGSDIDDSDDNLNQSSTREQVSALVLNDEKTVEEEEVESNHDDSEEEDESSESSDSSSDSDSDSVEGDEEDEAEEREVWNKDSHIMKQFEKSCDKMQHLKVAKQHSNNKIGSAMCKDEEQNDESEEEEEDDSGVTSDMSRHISETDTDPECSVSTRKMNSYQRAATHSRLFKLLQEECAQEDEEGNEVPKAPDEITMSRKDKLTLSLNEQPQIRERDSLSSSSGVDSPSSPNNFDQLANELVQSLLKRKKGRHFRKLPLAKLHDAAVRILKEDAGRCDAVSSPSDESNIYSPVDRVHIPSNRNSGSFADAYYGDNYHDYCNYYSTWGYPNYALDSINDSLGSDIVPSKTFKMLQEHTSTAGQVNSHLIEGLSAKCPRILSSKNVAADLQRCPTPSLLPSPSPSTET
ncbi:hypothetical protein LSTR_LSTR017368 [Laodelphax striatellus]|uniref:Uncharacterized protein n=1 Tax=Laodelphax striatellus TaxID=195883 RepID=A0A482WQG7_LAOST|nr:hypothetical protein LSTR_LSTR017368 [Laodelphax striatellus]